jgi:hypothetical protein
MPSMNSSTETSRDPANVTTVSSLGTVIPRSSWPDHGPLLNQRPTKPHARTLTPRCG